MNSNKKFDPETNEIHLIFPADAQDKLCSALHDACADALEAHVPSMIVHYNLVSLAAHVMKTYESSIVDSSKDGLLKELGNIVAALKAAKVVEKAKGEPKS